MKPFEEWDILQASTGERRIPEASTVWRVPGNEHIPTLGKGKEK